MRRPTLVLLAVLAVLLVAAGTATASPPTPATASTPAAVARADALVFATPLPAFAAVRGAPTREADLDWSSDGCSVPVLREPHRSTPHGFDFRDACARHDFGYRNAKAQGRFTEDLRHRIDDVFRADMGAVCAGESGWKDLRGRLCRHVAGDYHFWVRSCGAQPAPYCPLEARELAAGLLDR